VKADTIGIRTLVNYSVGLKDCQHKLDLPPSFAGVHDIFHVFQLKKCLKAPVDIVLPEVTLLKADLLYPELLIKILDQKNRVTRHKTIKFFKIQWNNHTEEEATWESEDFIRSSHLMRMGTRGTTSPGLSEREQGGYQESTHSA
jgi:hypothetical protein